MAHLISEHQQKAIPPMFEIETVGPFWYKNWSERAMALLAPLVATPL